MTDTEQKEEITEDQSLQESEELTPAPMTIGSLLKEKREEKHYSLRDISKATKISTTMLELLESDQLDKLPNKAYVSGYVKSYSKELGLDADEALEILGQSYNQTPTSTKNNSKKQKQGQKVEMPFKVSVPVLITALGCIALATMAAFYFVNRPVEEVATVKETTDNITPKTVSAITPLQTKEKPKSIEPPKAQPEEKKPEIKEVKVEKKKPEDKKEEKKRKFSKIRGALFSINTTGTKDALEKFVPESYQNAVIPGKQNVFVRAVTDNVWMTYKKDNLKIRKFSIKKGNTLLVSGDTVRMFIGNIKAAKVFLNNQLINTPSPSGVKSLIFPANSSTKYHLPLFVYLKNGKVITSEEFMKQQ